MAHYKTTKCVHNKWQAVIAFLTGGGKKKKLHFHQQINAVYQDKWEDTSPIQCWKVHVSNTSLTHASLNDNQCSRKLQIAAYQSHQNNADKICVLEHPTSRPYSVPHHFYLSLISLHTTFLQMSAWTLLLSVSFNIHSKIIHQIRYNYLTWIFQHLDLFCSLHIMNYEINLISIQIKKTMTRTTHILKDWEAIILVEDYVF